MTSAVAFRNVLTIKHHKEPTTTMEPPVRIELTTPGLQEYLNIDPE